MSSRPRSRARRGCSSTRWFTRLCAAAWAASCTRWRCRPPSPTRPDRIHPEIPMDQTVQQRIKDDIQSNDVVLYMKGSPVFPQCGFSAAVVQILTHLNVKFKGVDVLSDPSIRQGIKEFSNWPTIPQLYVKGEFIGGCDIIREMFQTGELQETLQSKGVKVA